MKTTHIVVWVWLIPIILVIVLWNSPLRAGGIGTLYYDGNSDGIADLKQANVCSVAGSSGNSMVTLEVQEGAVIDSMSVKKITETDFELFTLPDEAIEAHISGMATGETISLRLYLPDSVILDSYYSGIPRENTGAIEWNELTKTSAQNIGDDEQVVLLNLTDGGVGDLDYQKNGRLVFLSAPGQRTTPGTGGKLTSENVYCFPNPFNPYAHEFSNIRYSLARAGKVNIRIYDTGNRLVKRLIVDEEQEANIEYKIQWDGKNGAQQVVTNGVYFFVIETSEGERAVGKIAILQ